MFQFVADMFLYKLSLVGFTKWTPNPYNDGLGIFVIDPKAVAAIKKWVTDTPQIYVVPPPPIIYAVLTHDLDNMTKVFNRGLHFTIKDITKRDPEALEFSDIFGFIYWCCAMVCCFRFSPHFQVALFAITRRFSRQLRSLETWIKLHGGWAEFTSELNILLGHGTGVYTGTLDFLLEKCFVTVANEIAEKQRMEKQKAQMEKQKAQMEKQKAQMEKLKAQLEELKAQQRSKMAAMMKDFNAAVMFVF